MSFIDKAKQTLDQTRSRAGDMVTQHRDQIDQAIDKSGGYLDQRTGGKYSDKIRKAGDSAKTAATRIADQGQSNNGPAGGPPAS